MVFQTFSFPQMYPHIHATCPNHLVVYLITWTIYDEQYRSECSSLCSLFHSPITDQSKQSVIQSVCQLIIPNNQSFSQYVSWSVQTISHSVSMSADQDQLHIWIICPSLRWTWVQFLCAVGHRGYRNLMLWVSLCSVASTDADKENICGTSHYCWSCTRWCFPGCDVMWCGRLG
jgi:hypothetical protein